MYFTIIKWVCDKAYTGIALFTVDGIRYERYITPAQTSRVATESLLFTELERLRLGTSNLKPYSQLTIPYSQLTINNR